MFPALFVPPAIFGLPAFSASAIPATDLTVLAVATIMGLVGILGRLWLHQRTVASRPAPRPRPSTRSLGTLPIGTAAARPTA